MSEAMQEAHSNDATCRGLMDGSYCVFQKDIINFLRGWLDSDMKERYFAIFANEHHGPELRRTKDASQQVAFIFDKETNVALRYDPSATKPSPQYQQMFDETFRGSEWTLNHWTIKHHDETFETSPGEQALSKTSWVACIRFLCGIIAEAEAKAPDNDHGTRYIERFIMQGIDGPRKFLIS